MKKPPDRFDDRTMHESAPLRRGNAARYALAAPALYVAFAGLLLLTSRPAAALHYLEPEEAISEILVEPSEEEKARKREKEGEPGQKEKVSERTWAVVPQIGYGPETSFLAGGKFTSRNFRSSGITLDLDGVYAIEGQQSYTVLMASPRSFSDRFPVIVRAQYRTDPRRRFYGLGNNTQGPDQASSHEFQRFGGDVTVGWRFFKNCSLNVQGGAWQGDIDLGKEIDNEPQTVDRFPDLPGIDGGVLVPLAVSFVYNNREDQTRPTRGWRILLKGSYDVGEFHFGRFIGDVSYIYPLFHERVILGARVGGQYLGGDIDNIPFWAMADLGGEHTLRGYFPFRFLGTASLLGTLEARVKLFKFNIFDWWRVVVDGVGFGEIGRILIDDKDLAQQGDTSGRLAPTGEVPISYGTGLRFTMSEAILVRVDVGFSNEETALVYLTFGHTF
jgi:outer membrane protein assembly factor BamA